MLREALGSVLGQTLRDLEVIVCDNADDPETREVVTSFDDDRITYVGRPENIGMIGNALDGFRRCSGEFVIKLDDDDALEPHALETLAAAFCSRPEVTVSFCDLQLVDIEGTLMPQATEQLQRDTHRAGLRPGLHRPFSDLAVWGAACLTGGLVRRSAIEWSAVPQEAGTAYDLYLILAAARDGAAGWYTDQRLVRYRIHSANDSVKNVVPNLQATQWVLGHELDSHRHANPEVLHNRMAQDCSRLAREHLIAGDATQARRAAILGLRGRPSSQAAMTLVLSALPGGLGARISGARRRSYLAKNALGPAPGHHPS